MGWEGGSWVAGCLGSAHAMSYEPNPNPNPSPSPKPNPNPNPSPNPNPNPNPNLPFFCVVLDSRVFLCVSQDLDVWNLVASEIINQPEVAWKMTGRASLTAELAGNHLQISENDR